MHKNDKEWCETPRQSWEIENRLRLFDEAVCEGLYEVAKEKWDVDRKKKLEKALRELVQRMVDFSKVVWIAKHEVNRNEEGCKRI